MFSRILKRIHGQPLDGSQNVEVVARLGPTGKLDIITVNAG